MKLVIRHGEREEQVSVERSGDEYVVRIGEVEHRVEAVQAVNLLSLRTLASTHHEVAVHRAGEHRRHVHGRWRAAVVDVLDPLSALVEGGAGGAGGRRAAVVEAYMPGRVVAVLAEEGADVAAGQGVVVLEAMKMENEIQAETAGVVKQLHVVAGDAVDGGDPLFEIAPAET
ncbi:MAG: biotin/lipoyl-containing protein [Acidobacteriota bacterium]